MIKDWQKQRILEAIAANRQNYPSDAKHAAALGISASVYKMLKKGQNVRFDYQINDADNGKERTGLLHWHSPNDNTYADPSGWGDGKVVALPE